jgi:vacuolar-type H+-ATPase subunit I/STV1
MNKTSTSSDTSPSPESGATDSPWQPSWWQWLIFALSGTLEIERQIAWLEKSSEEARQRDEELRKRDEELRKSDEEARQRHELRMSELRKETEQVRKETEQLRKENERLAVFDCVTLRERIQNRWIILQVQYQVAPGEDARAALGNFVAFLQEYGE